MVFLLRELFYVIFFIVKMSFSKHIKYLFTFLAISSIAVSCSKDDPDPWWNNKDNPDKPAPTPDPDPEPEVPAEKPRFMWIDAPANFPRFADSQENIAKDLKKAYDSGITDVVVDIRPYTGDILFASSTGDPMVRIDVWDNGYHFYNRTATWDYLQTFIDKGHEIGLRVHAGFNTFVGGCKYYYGLGEDGMVYRDSSKKDWVTVLNLDGTLVNSMDCNDDDYSTKFLNPANDDVQNYIIALLRDLAKYDLDGIFLDRCRYDGIYADFSDVSKTKFEKYLGYSITGYPNSVWNNYEKEWYAFHAKTIHDFIVKARDAVKAVNPDVQFGVYVGAWYSEYYYYGVNWASPKYRASSNYSWANTEWDKYGYADHLDFLLLGAYAGADNIYGSTEWTCQGFCQLAKTKLCGDVKFAGGPDVGNGTGWTEGGRGNAVTQSIDACINASDGYFIFDMVHVRNYNYWNAIKTGVNKYKATVK